MSITIRREQRKASEIEIGWNLAVRGSELHEDLSGLICDLIVDEVHRDGVSVVLKDRYTQSEVWFKEDETVEATWLEVDQEAPDDE